ncbi:MAG TPA: hypothetical protein VMP68_28135 [Candidatus Eisenbacteria bacterium]|nr:hypothetical protein [Candidatus Eisenbacteria bacterium]
MNETSWTKERKLGVAGITGVAVGWGMLLCVQTFSSVCGSSARPLSWAVLVASLASPIAILWAAVKDKWWWAIGLLPAALLLLSFMGTFEGC